MKYNLKSILTPVLLGGCWGVLTYIVGSLISAELPVAQSLFYPVFFGGVVAIVAVTVDSKIPFARALTVGLISGFVYGLLSPIFPFLSSVIAGASLGGGLVAEEPGLKDVFNRLLSILKGILLFPVFIYIGNFLTILTVGVLHSHFLLWFLWGVLITATIFSISVSLFEVANTEGRVQTFSDVDEFKSETQEILRELNELESRYK